MLISVFAAVLLFAHGNAAPALQKLQPWGFFVNNTIYQTTGSESTTYPRFVELSDGTILATAWLGGHSPPYFPVFESKDGGATWDYISNVTDQVNGWGMSAQPALAELTEPLGGYASGTILASGNSMGQNGTRIDLYASTDGARTWEFVSRVAEGSATGDGDPIWEPFLMVYNHSLVCYYSDERDPNHSQKLSHQVSTDLKTWEPPVDDVSIADFSARPGMTVITYIPPISKWIFVFELNQFRDGTVTYPAHYLLADSPLDFRLSEALPIIPNNSDRIPNASPYVTWSPLGGPNGTLVVSDGSSRAVWTNRVGGAVDGWESHDVPAGVTYARAVHVLDGYPEHLMTFGGETFGGMGSDRHVPLTVTVLNLTELLES